MRETCRLAPVSSTKSMVKTQKALFDIEIVLLEIGSHVLDTAKLSLY